MLSRSANANLELASETICRLAKVLEAMRDSHPLATHDIGIVRGEVLSLRASTTRLETKIGMLVDLFTGISSRLPAPAPAPAPAPKKKRKSSK